MAGASAPSPILDTPGSLKLGSLGGGTYFLAFLQCLNYVLLTDALMLKVCEIGVNAKQMLLG